MSNSTIIPFSLRDAPALIEHLLPVQKLSMESYKEQMANVGKALTALGSYWKGRKPLILAKACVLGSLLPTTGDLPRDLEIFELLMGMDQQSLEKRLEEKNSKESRFFLSQEPTVRLNAPYLDWVREGCRPEECGDSLFSHIWDEVNTHLGTQAQSFPELVEQLGIMRFGHRPRVADTFCGSGQIPFEAARLGCDVYASDLNPVACMLTWGALHIVGGSPESREQLAVAQQKLVEKVQAEIEQLGVETDGHGWRAKAFLYCLEARCPQTNWRVPLIPSLIISKGKGVIAELVPDTANQRYDIAVRAVRDGEELKAAAKGTVRTDGRGQDPYLIHTVDSKEYRTKISTLRGDYRNDDGSSGNQLRFWEKSDFKPQSDDIFQERLYAIHWMRRKTKTKREDYEFRAVTSDDLKREQIVDGFVAAHLVEWQEKGWMPDMRIEPGDKTDEPIRTRGWTHWHHLFNPRQLLYFGLTRRYIESIDFNPSLYLIFSKSLDWNSRLCRWYSRWDKTENVFYNQALNTLFNYGTRSFAFLSETLEVDLKKFPIKTGNKVKASPSDQLEGMNDIYITDPPYGDAVKYEEILEFFIAWLRKTPPPEFADWTWDSRRSLAIKGNDHEFLRNMVAAYKRMADHMPDNGLQIIMFTHQSGSLWADMANIVWASGLRVTAAWYVATETDSALRVGSYVKGTILLVVRKRQGQERTSRDDLAWDIEEEVREQVNTLSGLNQNSRGLHRDDNLFSDADLQMAGYAAALRVLTRYAVIDGKDMPAEALRPRVKGQTTVVDELIDFAVSVANRCLTPAGLADEHWKVLQPAERFYLKMLELEAKGFKTLDNYQNFAKAYKVRDFKPLLASHKANAAQLKSAQDFGRTEMSGDAELANTPLRGVLYALMELQKDLDGDDVLSHLSLNVPDYYPRRPLLVALADYLAQTLKPLRDDEARQAAILRELVRNQPL